MDTVTDALIAIPMHAPSNVDALSWWRRLTERATAKLSARLEANALRDHAHDMMAGDPRFAADLRAAADMHEQRYDH